MGIMAGLLAAAVAAAPQVELSTLSGEQHTGRLERLTATTVTLAEDGGGQSVPVAQVLDVRFPHEPAPEPERKLARVALVDGSQFGCAALTTSVREAKLESPWLGDFQVPAAAIASIRFAPEDEVRQVDDAWNELLKRDLRRDLLVVRKENVLDHLEGTVGDINEKTIKFLIDGEEVPVRRERVFGVIYSRPRAAGPRPVCEVRIGPADLVKLKSISWDGEGFQAALLTGASVQLPLGVLRSLDFSLGKVRYLSDMEPREIKYTPIFDEEVYRHWIQYQRDHNGDLAPLRIGEQTFARGLWIHSETSLTYRLAGDYRRFQAVMGIDYPMALQGRGSVRLVIRGDGRPLLDAEVRGPDEPTPIDLDVTGVRDLQIVVDTNPPGHLISGNHLNLGDARVIK